MSTIPPSPDATTQRRQLTRVAGANAVIGLAGVAVGLLNLLDSPRLVNFIAGDAAMAGGAVALIVGAYAYETARRLGEGT